MNTSNMSRGGWLFAASLGAVAAWASFGLAAEPGQLTVKVDQPGVKIGPMHFGLMTEEINHSYDGGVYAELVRNRIFKDDPKTPVHWSVVASPDAAGSITLDTDDPVNATALTTSLRLDIATAGPDQRGGSPTMATGASPRRPIPNIGRRFTPGPAAASPALDRGH